MLIWSKLVNPQQESYESNTRVQECLANVKQARKQIVRYIQVSLTSSNFLHSADLSGQLVENEDMIGVLIETNDRIIAAIENYDLVSRTEQLAWCRVTHSLA